MSEEELRDVVGYEGVYRVSNLGNIYSTENRFHARHRNKKLAIEYTRVGNRPYIRLTRKHRHEAKNIPIAKIVAMAFISGYKNCLQINHKDGNKFNNRADNLEWVTRKENMKHAAINFLQTHGEDHHNAKLSEENVLDIWKRIKAGDTNRKIADDYGVCISNIRNIRHGIIWISVYCKVHNIDRGLNYDIFQKYKNKKKDNVEFRRN